MRGNMFKAFLIKYAEIGVKGKNRDLFEAALAQQIKYACAAVKGNSGSAAPGAGFISMPFPIMIMRKPWKT